MTKSNRHKNIQLRMRRKVAIRKKIFGTTERPRLNVYRSLNHIYAQVIDDTKGHTLAAASTLMEEMKQNRDKKRVEQAFLVGEILAKLCLEKNVQTVCFDRNGFKYHGRIKALADGARKGGLKF